MLLVHHAIFFFNDTATTEIYTLSLHDALPISDTLLADPQLAAAGERLGRGLVKDAVQRVQQRIRDGEVPPPDRKSTRLNSSHANISYAVFCLKKKTSIKSRTPNILSSVFCL